MTEDPKYLEVIVARQDSYCAGQVKHEGTTCYAPGYLSDEQVKSILGDKSGIIKARFVDAVPEGAKVVGAPAAGNPGPNDKGMNAADTIAKIKELATAEEVEALIKDDTRKTVQEAGAARIAELNKPSE